MSGGKFYSTQKFNALDKKWKNKLKKSGFNDIEQDEDHLKQWHSRYFMSRFHPNTFKSQQEYYQLAGAFLHEYAFATPLERMVWECHSEGMAIKQIYNHLVEQDCKMHLSGIRRVVKNLTKIMVDQCQSKKNSSQPETTSPKTGASS